MSTSRDTRASKDSNSVIFHQLAHEAKKDANIEKENNLSEEKILLEKNNESKPAPKEEKSSDVAIPIPGYHSLELLRSAQSAQNDSSGLCNRFIGLACISLVVGTIATPVGYVEPNDYETTFHWTDWRGHNHTRTEVESHLTDHITNPGSFWVGITAFSLSFLCCFTGILTKSMETYNLRNTTLFVDDPYLSSSRNIIENEAKSLDITIHPDITTQQLLQEFERKLNPETQRNECSPIVTNACSRMMGWGQRAWQKLTSFSIFGERDSAQPEVVGTVPLKNLSP